MEKEHMQALGIDATMTVVRTDSKNQNKRGQDTDIDFYDVLNESGDLIAKCEVWDTTSMFPPQERFIELKKYAPDGKQII